MDTFANSPSSTEELPFSDEEPSNNDLDLANKPETKNSQLARLLGLLKFVGAGIVVAAMALFLFEGITVTNDSQRFFTILGFGGALTALGLAVNKWLQDRVASRLFIGLSLASIPVIATVLGGLVFSLTDAAKALSLPTIATWQIANAAHLYWAIPIGLAVVAMIAVLGLMVMARSEWRWMSPALIVSNALLVIPIRDSVFITVLVATAIVALIVWIRKKTIKPIAFKTAEGRWALGVLFFAPAIMLARTLLLYNTDLFMGACASTVAYGAARYWFQRCRLGCKENVVAYLFTLVTGITAVITVALYLVPMIPNDFYFGHGRDGAIAAVSTFSMLPLAYDAARKHPSWFLSRFMHTFILLGVATSLLIQTLILGLSPVLTAITVGILLGFSVLHSLRRWYVEAVIALIIALSLIIRHGDWLWGTLLNTGWWGLAALGISVLVGGALLERTLMTRRKVTEIPV